MRPIIWLVLIFFWLLKAMILYPVVTLFSLTQTTHALFRKIILALTVHILLHSLIVSKLFRWTKQSVWQTPLLLLSFLPKQSVKHLALSLFFAKSRVSKHPWTKSREKHCPLTFYFLVSYIPFLFRLSPVSEEEPYCSISTKRQVLCPPLRRWRAKLGNNF